MMRIPWPALLLAGFAMSGCSRVAAPPAPPVPPALPAVDVVELSATTALERMAAGTLSSQALTSAYIDRIGAIDDAGPALHAVIEINVAAMNEAATLDAERAAGKLRGVLHGLPVLLKDNIDVAGMVTSAGSLALAAHRPARDAFLVQRLRAAGAVILGKTNLSEWANFRSTRAVSGWSSRGGQTRNPYVLDRNPCGSSAGTGAAIAASLAALGVGTETDGSLLCPAAVNGLAAIKPTVGLVSRDGIIPISSTQDTAGPMARNVRDAALLLQALAGPDVNDEASVAARDHAGASYALKGAPASLRGTRLGLLRQAMGLHPDVDAAMEAAVAKLREAGAEVIDVSVPTWRQWNSHELLVLLHEFKAGLNRYLANATEGPRSLSALIEWNRQHAADVMPLFGQELFERADAAGASDDADYVKARAEARRLALDEGLMKVLQQHRLDALIAPTTGPAWPTDPVLGDHFIGGGYGMAAVAGTPSLTIPMGAVQGLPLGLTFMGPAWSEQRLLAYGDALERLLGARQPPTFRPTLNASN